MHKVPLSPGKLLHFRKVTLGQCLKCTVTPRIRKRGQRRKAQVPLQVSLECKNVFLNLLPRTHFPEQPRCMVMVTPSVSKTTDRSEYLKNKYINLKNYLSPTAASEEKLGVGIAEGAGERGILWIAQEKESTSLLPVTSQPDKWQCPGSERKKCKNYFSLFFLQCFTLGKLINHNCYLQRVQ